MGQFCSNLFNLLFARDGSAARPSNGSTTSPNVYTKIEEATSDAAVQRAYMSAGQLDSSSTKSHYQNGYNAAGYSANVNAFNGGYGYQAALASVQPPPAAVAITTTPTTSANGHQISGSIQIPIQNSIKPKHSATVSTQSKSAFYMNYELREEVGVGSTSKCYRCVKKSTGVEYACKVIDKRQVEMKFSGLLDQFFLEIKVLKSLNHPNIIHLEDTYDSPDRIYIIMEIMKGGELFDYVVEKGTLSEEEASLLVRKITSAVAHMHGQGIIHRDLKPENLLLTSRGPTAEVKLIDFGLAKVMQEPVANSFLGTKGYLAPEMLQRVAYDKAIDMWALGVIVFVLLCGCLPFDDDSSRISSETQARKKFALRFPKWAASLSSSAKDLLHNLLEINPKTRYTADQALNHPWVSGKTVLMNSYLKSPSVMGERRNELRSPQLQGYIYDTHSRASQGAAATARNTYGLNLPPASAAATSAGKGTAAAAQRAAYNANHPTSAQQEVEYRNRKYSI